MRKLLQLLMLVFIFTYTLSSEDSGFKYKNLGIKLDTHETTLATSEKLTPIYTELKYSFNKDKKISPFIKGDLGFSYVEEMEETNNMKDMRSNNYYSMGTGLDIGKNLTIEAAYVTYQMGYMEDQDEVDENRIMLKIKYRY